MPASPKVNYYFAIAVPKGSETSWKETEWGKSVTHVAQMAFPQQFNLPHFAWKIIDGDSSTPNQRGGIPCEKEGYKGCWILNFSSSFAPKIVSADGKEELTEIDAIKPGYFVEVYGSISGNNSQQKPGLFLNHSVIALSGYADIINLGINPAALGLGRSALPEGATTTPESRLMTDLANGETREQLIAKGWTDELLISQGLMKP